MDADPQGTARTFASIATEKGFPAPTVVAMGEGMHRKDQLPRLAAGFDIIVIDCPPRLGGVQRSAFMASDLVILPCGPSPGDAWALTESIEVVRAAQEIRPFLRAYLLVSRKIQGTSLGAGAQKALLAFDVPVLRSELVTRIAYAESLASGKGVTQNEPKSQAAQEVRALVGELEEILFPPAPKEGATNGKTERKASPARTQKTSSSGGNRSVHRGAGDQ